MSAVEEFSAAIEKLLHLKAESTPPVGGRAWVQGEDSKRWENAREVYTGPDENAPGSADVATCFNPADAALIAALHATIDAQIGVLTRAHNMAVSGREAVLIVNMNLARAINGTAGAL